MQSLAILTALIISAIYEDCRFTSMIYKITKCVEKSRPYGAEIMAMAMIYVAPLVKWHYCYDMIVLKQKMMMKLRCHV